jgi:hypothetical protein
MRICGGGVESHNYVSNLSTSILAIFCLAILCQQVLEQWLDLMIVGCETTAVFIRASFVLHLQPMSEEHGACPSFPTIGCLYSGLVRFLTEMFAVLRLRGVVETLASRRFQVSCQDLGIFAREISFINNSGSMAGANERIFRNKLLS